MWKHVNTWQQFDKSWQNWNPKVLKNYEDTLKFKISNYVPSNVILLQHVLPSFLTFDDFLAKTSLLMDFFFFFFANSSIKKVGNDDSRVFFSCFKNMKGCIYNLPYSFFRCHSHTSQKGRRKGPCLLNILHTSQGNPIKS